MATYQPRMGARHASGYDDSFHSPPPPPELISPEPQRHMPEMSSQIQNGLQHMTLDHRESVMSSGTTDDHHFFDGHRSIIENETPRFSPFPELKNRPSTVPPSDEEFEETLWNARNLVLDSTDAEMQLAWAADALIYVGISADNEERIAAAKPSAARPSTPHIEHTLKTDAMSIVTFLSSQHHPKAEFLKGMWLEWGRYGQREDKKEAFRCYSRAADKGYARAEYRIGMLYESFNDAPKALRHYHRGVDAGDSASCYRLGMMTLRGQHGQQQDWQRAIELIKQSAETADENAAQGAYVYGMLLARQLPQITVPDAFLQLDELKARTFIEKAAFLKFAKAQLKMGLSYELGALGCNFSPALSVHYYALASKQGEPEADMALSKWFLVGHEGLFSKNEELSFMYAERAATTGLATAEFAMGYFYEIGMSVPIDTKKAMDWYQKASEHGNDDAKGRIDALSKRQYLSKKDHDQVAIQRIKSMHNSQRGERPDRKPVPVPKLGNVSEEGYNTQQNFPPRGASAAPYPMNDRTPSGGPRPGSSAPYPLNDAPAQFPPSPGLRNYAQPPRSASTTYPDQRPPPMQRPGPQQMPYNDPYNQNAGPPRSPRPDMYPPQQRPIQGQRVGSAPSPYMQQGQGFSPQPSPRPQYPPSAPGSPYQGPQRPPPQQQRPDIGYSAPYEDRRYRPGGPQQGPPPQGRTPQPQGGRPSPAPSQQSQYSQGRPQPGGPTPRPPAKDPIPPQSPPAPKPKPGPTTFEEMGVHGKKNGEDCVMM